MKEDKTLLSCVVVNEEEPIVPTDVQVLDLKNKLRIAIRKQEEATAKLAESTSGWIEAVALFVKISDEISSSSKEKQI